MTSEQEIQMIEEAEADAIAAAGSADLIYGLEDRPPVRDAIFAAVQHVLAMFVGIITPPLIISGALGLEPVAATYIVSMSLFISGVASFIQARRFGPLGSGLLSIQGTSFTFLGPIIATGLAAIEGGTTPEAALATIFGVCFVGAFIEMALSRFLDLAQRIITPLVTGTVVTLIGLTLINTGMISIAGGVPAQGTDAFGSPTNLGLAAMVLVIIIVLNIARNPFLRMASVAIGLIAGYVVSIPLGLVNFSNLSGLPLFSFPIPFRFGFGFNFGSFIPFIFLYLITTIESIGDMTATSVLTNQPIRGPLYFRRIKGGVLGDGFNSALAAVFNTFPNTTFSQNNGVIQLTGVGSRYVGYYVAAILALLGLFPIVGGVFQAIPQPVLGGATIIMFGSVAVAGLRIISTVEIDRRAAIILAVSLGLGLGVTFVPEALDQTPSLVKSIFASGITTGGMSALILNLILPGRN
ncbi:MAG: nucleobase:cation symporter-2 family protein [Thainema sp.]